MRPPPAPARRLAAALLVLVTTAAVLLLSASPASAHATMVSSTPTANKTVPEAPVEVVVKFSEPVSVVASGTGVTAPNGAKAHSGTPVSEGEQVRYKMRGSLPDGTYVVSYRVISADGHPVPGGFTFSVGKESKVPEAADPGNTANPLVTWLVYGNRFAGYAGLLLVLGPALLLLAGDAGSRSGARRLTVTGLSAVAATSVIGLYLQAPYTAGTSLFGITGADVGSVLGSRFGGASMARLLLVLIALPLLYQAMRRRPLAAVRGTDGKPVARGGAVAARSVGGKEAVTARSGELSAEGPEVDTSTNAARSVGDKEAVAAQSDEPSTDGPEDGTSADAARSVGDKETATAQLDGSATIETIDAGGDAGGTSAVAARSLGDKEAVTARLDESSADRPEDDTSADGTEDGTSAEGPEGDTSADAARSVGNKEAVAAQPGEPSADGTEDGTSAVADASRGDGGLAEADETPTTPPVANPSQSTSVAGRPRADTSSLSLGMKWLLGGLAVALAATWPVSGHATTSAAPALTVLSDTVHIAAATVWLGGLLTLALFLVKKSRTAAAEAFLPTWSRWATWIVASLAIAGLAQALIHIGTVDGLVSTTYGWLVMAKIGLFAVLLGTAALARKAVRRIGSEDVVPQVRQLIQTELLIGALVLGMSAVLVQAVPAQSTRAASVDQAPQTFSKTFKTEHYTLQFELEPVKAGPNEAHLYLFEPDGVTELEAQQWQASFGRPDDGIQLIPFDLALLSPNHTSGDVSVPRAGKWTFEFTIRVSKLDRETVSTVVSVK